MNRERIKSLVLACLVIINFFLGAKILTDKKLWPNGYNFFSFEKSGLFKAFTSSQDKKSARTHIIMPEQIIVNTGDQTSRISLSPNVEIFSDIYEVSNKIMASGLGADEKNVYYSPKNEWVSALNGKSVCFFYPVLYDTKLFGEFYNTDSSALSAFVPSFSQVILSEDGTIYFENAQNGEFYKVATNKKASDLSSIINKSKALYKNNTSVINYSVDLKFDEATESQKASLASTVQIYSSPVKAPLLAVSNPVSYDGTTINGEVIEKILAVFDINSNTARKYPEVDGTLVFVENDGILKISPQGLLQYQSTASSGFYLASGASYTDSVQALSEFASSLTKIFANEKNLFLSSDLNGDSEQITFDYRAAGYPVKMNYKNQANAICAEIRNGAIISYSQVLRNYIPSAASYELPEYMSALDSTIERYSVDLNNFEISKMYVSYSDNGNLTSKHANWDAKVKSIIIEN